MEVNINARWQANDPDERAIRESNHDSGKLRKRLLARSFTYDAAIGIVGILMYLLPQDSQPFSAHRLVAEERERKCLNSSVAFELINKYKDQQNETPLSAVVLARNGDNFRIESNSLIPERTSEIRTFNGTLYVKCILDSVSGNPIRYDEGVSPQSDLVNASYPAEFGITLSGIPLSTLLSEQYMQVDARWPERISQASDQRAIYVYPKSVNFSQETDPAKVRQIVLDNDPTKLPLYYALLAKSHPAQASCQSEIEHYPLGASCYTVEVSWELLEQSYVDGVAYPVNGLFRAMHPSAKQEYIRTKVDLSHVLLDTVFPSETWEQRIENGKHIRDIVTGHTVMHGPNGHESVSIEDLEALVPSLIEGAEGGQARGENQPNKRGESEKSNCGVSAAYLYLRSRGLIPSGNELFVNAKIATEKTSSVAEICDLLTANGSKCHALEANWKALESLREPFVLYLHSHQSGIGHFVAAKAKDQSLWVCDPAESRNGFAVTKADLTGYDVDKFVVITDEQVQHQSRIRQAIWCGVAIAGLCVLGAMMWKWKEASAR
jgi:hypothetical protein